MSKLKAQGNTSGTGVFTLQTPNSDTDRTITLPDSTGTLVDDTTVDLGNWTVTETGGVLYFATGGTNKMKLDVSGNLTCVGDVTAYGTV